MDRVLCLYKSIGMKPRVSRASVENVRNKFLVMLATRYLRAALVISPKMIEVSNWPTHVDTETFIRNGNEDRSARLDNPASVLDSQNWVLKEGKSASQIYKILRPVYNFL